MQTSQGRGATPGPRLPVKCDVGDYWLNHHINHNTEHTCLETRINLYEFLRLIIINVADLRCLFLSPNPEPPLLIFFYNSDASHEQWSRLSRPPSDVLYEPQNIDDFINQFVVNNSHTSVFLSLIQFKIEHLIDKVACFCYRFSIVSQPPLIRWIFIQSKFTENEKNTWFYLSY